MYQHYRWAELTTTSEAVAMSTYFTETVSTTDVSYICFTKTSFLSHTSFSNFTCLVVGFLKSYLEEIKSIYLPAVLLPIDIILISGFLFKSPVLFKPTPKSKWEKTALRNSIIFRTRAVNLLIISTSLYPKKYKMPTWSSHLCPCWPGR